MGKKKRILLTGATIFALFFIVSAFLFSEYYNKIYKGITVVNSSNEMIYVKSDWQRSDLINHLFNEGILTDTASFVWVANQKSFNKLIAGKYRLKSNMSNNELVNIFRSGKQEMVQLSFHSIRTMEDLAGRVSKQIEADSSSLITTLKTQKIAAKYGFNRNTFLSMFIPNTYEFYWNTSVEAFVKRMATEYKRFWTDERKAKAQQLGLSQSEVTILASIVQAEQLAHPDERPKVAGLYINRLKKGIPLQSDPTLIYAILYDQSIKSDWVIQLRNKGVYPKRVLNKYKKVESKYNTYDNSGLPPGPVNVPEISSLNAVLNYERHSYLYMCAKADFSGYHHFSKTLSQHNVYARAYRKELNKRGIYR